MDFETLKLYAGLIIAGCVFVWLVWRFWGRYCWYCRRLPDFLRPVGREIVRNWRAAVRDRSRELWTESRWVVKEQPKKSYPKLKKIYPILQDDFSGILVVSSSSHKLFNYLATAERCQAFGRDLGMTAEEWLELDTQDPRARRRVGIRIGTATFKNEIRELNSADIAEVTW